MPDDFTVKWNSKGIKAILTGNDMLSDMERRALNIASAAGEGFEVRSEIGPRRARAAVITATSEAIRAEIRDRALIRALDAGRQ